MMARYKGKLAPALGASWQLSLDGSLGQEAMRAVCRSLGEADLGDEATRIRNLGVLLIVHTCKFQQHDSVRKALAKLLEGVLQVLKTEGGDEPGPPRTQGADSPEDRRLRTAGGNKP